MVLAFGAALLSWVDPTPHGSVANGALVHAGHWVLLFLLASARVHADRVLKTDVEVTWLLYGFLLGEIDADSGVALTLVFLSAILFQRHRRKLRVDEDEENAVRELPDLPDQDTAAF